MLGGCRAEPSPPKRQVGAERRVGAGVNGSVRGPDADQLSRSGRPRTAGLTPAPSLEPRWRRRGFLLGAPSYDVHPHARLAIPGAFRKYRLRIPLLWHGAVVVDEVAPGVQINQSW